jgi:hypothetical protein
MPQDGVDPTSLERVCADLAAPGLLFAKDATAGLLVACCLVEMLRLHAPRQPFEPQQLSVIDSLGVKIRGIDPKIPSKKRTFSIRSASICCTLRTSTRRTSSTASIF